MAPAVIPRAAAASVAMPSPEVSRGWSSSGCSVAALGAGSAAARSGGRSTTSNAVLDTSCRKKRVQ